MNNIYLEYNNSAKKYFIDYLKNLKLETFKYDRCLEEINLLFQKDLLYIIYYLYIFKKDNNSVDFFIGNSFNNLLFLYLLGLTNIDPLMYNLPYELFNEKYVNINIFNYPKNDFIKSINVLMNKDLEITKKPYKKEVYEEVNQILKNRYIIIPKELIDKKILKKDKYIINNKKTITTYKFTELQLTEYDEKDILKINHISGILNNNLEKKLEMLFEPISILDYARIKSIARCTNAWNNNQEYVFLLGKMNLDTLITCKEDIYWYLKSHNIEKNTILDIINLVCKHDCDILNLYINIMKQNNCDDTFISIIKRIEHICSLGDSLSKCIYINDRIKKEIADDKKS